MTQGVPERIRAPFADHEAFEVEHRGGEGIEEEFVVTTTGFDARVIPVTVDGGETAGTTDETEGTSAGEADAAPRYRVVVRVPTLSGAVEGSVADVVEEGWLDTFRLRLEDAAMAIPGNATITGPEADVENETVVVRATVREGSTTRAPQTTKALVDYVEGTYAEGVVPGYEYRPPVSDLIASAHQDDSEADPGGPMPM